MTATDAHVATSCVTAPSSDVLEIQLSGTVEPIPGTDQFLMLFFSRGATEIAMLFDDGSEYADIALPLDTSDVFGDIGPQPVRVLAAILDERPTAFTGARISGQSRFEPIPFDWSL